MKLTRARNTWYWGNLILVVPFVLESKKLSNITREARGKRRVMDLTRSLQSRAAWIPELYTTQRSSLILRHFWKKQKKKELETKISRVNKMSIRSLPLSLSLFPLSIEHLWAKTIDGLSMRSQIWTVSRSMLTSELTVHMLKCIVRGHVCCPVILDSSFQVPTKTKRKKKQCIANTIKNTIELPLHSKGRPVE